MKVSWMILCGCMSAALSAQTEKEKDPVRVRVRRNAEDATMVDAVLVDASGNEHQMRLNTKHSRRSANIPDFPVYLGNGQIWKRNSPELDDVEIEKEGDDIIATPLKRTAPEAEPLYDDTFGLPLREGDYTDEDLGLPKMAFKRSSIVNPLADDFVATSHAVERVALRKRQQGNIHAVVDILVVVDNTVFRETLAESNNSKERAINALKRYYRLLVALVDLRYSQIDSSNLAIRTRMSGIYIAEERAGSPWTARTMKHHSGKSVVDPNVALDKLHEWLVDEADNLPSYDHAMSFTTYELVASNGHTAAGMAYIATVCQKDGYACSIIHEGGGLTSVSTAVHELGHGLGARHDGYDDNAACPISWNHVMSPGNSGPMSVRKNFFTFSRCSIRQFQSFLRSDKASCVFDTRPDRLIPAHVAAQEYTPDDQCKEMYGDESGLCQLSIQSEAEICVRVWCTKPDGSGRCLTSSSLAALYGTPCGPNKMCAMGECVSKSEVLQAPRIAVGSGRPAPRPPTPRPRPVQPRPTRPVQAPRCRADRNTGYCRTLIYQRPETCRSSNVQRYCCFTCSFVLG